MTKNSIKPFVKWAGGKQSLLKDIIPKIPKFDTYYEPFLGGGAVFWAIKPKISVISDINVELISSFRVIQQDYKVLFEAETEFIRMFGDLFSEESYKAIRDYNTSITEFIAYRFIYLNKTGFNGLYRVNKQGKFNSPYGHGGYREILNASNLFCCHNLLKSAAIRYSSFEEVLNLPVKGDFVFLDPPYLPISATSNFVDYTSNGFTFENLLTLKGKCLELDQEGVKFMLFNSDCELVHSTFEDFNIELVEARRSINSDGEKRGKINEVMITNY